MKEGTDNITASHLSRMRSHTKVERKEIATENWEPKETCRWSSERDFLSNTVINMSNQGCNLTIESPGLSCNQMSFTEVV
jgi:hypothetical protein